MASDPSKEDLEKVSSHRESYSAPQFYSSATTRRLPPTIYPPSPSTVSSTRTTPAQSNMYTLTKNQRDEPNVGTLELSGDGSLASSDDPNSSKIVRGLPNMANPLLPSAKGEISASEEDKEFNIERDRTSGVSLPGPYSPSSSEFAFDREDRALSNATPIPAPNAPSTPDTANDSTSGNPVKVTTPHVVEDSLEEFAWSPRESIDVASISGNPAEVTTRHISGDSLEAFGWPQRESIDVDSTSGNPAEVTTRHISGDSLEAFGWPQRESINPTADASSHAEDLLRILDSMSLASRGSSMIHFVDLDPPRFSVEVPAGAFDAGATSNDIGLPQDDSTGSQDTSRVLIGTFAGYVSDGSSQRPMSLRMIEESVRQLVNQRITTTNRTSSIYSAYEQPNDWETISDVRGTRADRAGERYMEQQNSSSVANTSDDGEVPIAEPLNSDTTPSGAQPRVNRSFVLLKDEHTGHIQCVLQSEFEGHRRALNIGANTLTPFNTPSNAYRHPPPFTTPHFHPFRSSPPDISPQDLPTVQHLETHSPAAQKPTSMSSISESSSHAAMASHDPTPNPQQEAIKGSHEHSEAMDQDFQEQTHDYKGQSARSSTWLSTMSEGEVIEGGSSEALSADRDNSFEKVAVFGGKGNITGTPEGTGAREVGSSLADASSEIASTPEHTVGPQQTHNFSLPLPTMPQQPAPTYRRPSRQERRREQRQDRHVTPSASTNSRAPRERRQDRHVTPSASTNSLAPRVVDPALGPNDIEMNYLRTSVDRARNSTTSSLLREPSLRHSNLEEYLAYVRSSTVTRPIPPANRLPRPVARASSPHLYRIPREPTGEMIARRDHISLCLLVLTGIIPPCALILGYGGLDFVINMITEGEIMELSEWAKVVGLAWGYGGTAIIIAVIGVVVGVFGL